MVNTIKVMSSLSVYLTTLSLGRLCSFSGKQVPVRILSPIFQISRFLLLTH